MKPTSVLRSMTSGPPLGESRWIRSINGYDPLRYKVITTFDGII